MNLETKTKIMEPEVLMEEYRHLLQQDDAIDALPLVISGNSMSPFLIHGRDTIFLSRLTRPVRRGDAVLYRRDNGAYIFHRVYRVEGDTYTMVGDAQVALERGIRRDQIIAIMTSAIRKGKRQQPGCFWWEFFEKVWIRMIPVRLPLRAAYSRFRRLLGRN